MPSRWRDWCTRRRAGNPFFAIQFMSALAEEGLLTFDHDDARWDWDLERIHAKGYTDNVADLMLGKLSRLPIATQLALRQLACLGNRATVGHPDHGPGRRRGIGARGALGCCASRAGLAGAGGLPLPARPGPGGRLCASSRKRAGRSAPADRPAARCAYAAKRGRGEHLRDRRPAQPRRGL